MGEYLEKMKAELQQYEGILADKEANRFNLIAKITELKEIIEKLEK